MAILNSPIDGLPVICTIRHYARDLTFDLFEQNWYLPGIMHIVTGEHAGDDLARIRIDGHMQFAPGQLGAAVLLRIPFAASKQLQTRAVDHEVESMRFCGEECRQA